MVLKTWKKKNTRGALISFYIFSILYKGKYFDTLKFNNFEFVIMINS